jgi:MoxR-like ATPase
MLMVKVGYPTREEERLIIDRATNPVESRATSWPTRSARRGAQDRARRLHGRRVKDYIVDVVFATREPAQKGLRELASLIEYGCEPRATIALALAARAHAFLRHRGYVTPEDVKAVGPDVLRHRVVLTYEAEAEEITAEQIVRRVFEVVEVP